MNEDSDVIAALVAVRGRVEEVAKCYGGLVGEDRGSYDGESRTCLFIEFSGRRPHVHDAPLIRNNFGPTYGVTFDSSGYDISRVHIHVKTPEVRICA